MKEKKNQFLCTYEVFSVLFTWINSSCNILFSGWPLGTAVIYSIHHTGKQGCRAIRQVFMHQNIIGYISRDAELHKETA